MSLEILNIDEIPETSLVKNPMIFKVQTDNTILVPGLNAVSAVTLTTGNPTNNQTLILEFNGIELTFTFKTTPDESGLQLPLGTYTSSAYIDELVEAFHSNYTINKYFVVTNAGASKLAFTARTNGPLFQIVFTGTVSKTSNDDVVGIFEQLYPNFRVGCNIFQGESDGFPSEAIAELLNAIDDDGICEFDVSTYLLPYLDAPILPAFHAQSFSILADHKKTFYLQFHEYYGTPPTYQKALLAGDYYVIRGGIPSRRIPEYVDFITDYLSSNRWMSFQPLKREVTMDQHQYCNWFNYTTQNSFNLNVKVYFTDGTDTEINPFFQITVEEGEIVCFPLGYSQLNLGSVDSTKTIYKYICSVRSGSTGNRVAQDLTFTLVDNHFNEKYFLFEGSLGTFESFRSTGAAELGIEVEKEEISRLLPLGFTLNDFERKQRLTEYNEEETVSSGPLDLSALNALVEILISEHVYLVTDSAYERIEIKAGKFKIRRDDNAAYSLMFSYSKSIQTLTTDLLDA